MQETQARIMEAARLIRTSSYLTAFTGAGISVESGIPPFRGPGGLWSQYDPRMLELDYFLAHPEKAWPVIREIFYDHFGKARPNRAHEVLAAWERDGWPREPGAGVSEPGAAARKPGDGPSGAGQGAAPDGRAAPGAAPDAPDAPDGRGHAPGSRGYLKVLITQNIDNLHFEAGSRSVVEFHGNSRTLACLSCGAHRDADPAALTHLPPRCPCGGLYKPDFIFFGEGIPPEALKRSAEATSKTDVMIVVGSTGEVYPAAMVPREARENGARIIEVNPEPSEFTDSVTHVFIPMKAGDALSAIKKELDR